MFAWFTNLSLAKKQICVLLVAGLVPLTIVAILASQVASNQLEKQAFSQLESVQRIKAAAIKNYFETVDNQILTMAENPTVISAMKTFARTFVGNDKADAWSEEERQNNISGLKRYYTEEFGAKYKEDNHGKQADVDSLMGGLSDNALNLQFHYIQNNEHALGEKHLLNRGEGASVYHRMHAKYHPMVRSFLEKFGYYDIFLVDINSGDIVYSVFKELDYATSLLDGPYADTNFAEAFREARDLPQGESVLKDFRSYTPSYESPASFIATPIYTKGEAVGVLVFQMPLEPINRIMGERSGMGETGESYLVGEDYLMRSDSYLDPVAHSVVESFRTPEKGAVRTEAATEALAGRSDNKIIIDYNGNPVLSSYDRIQLKGFNWAILAEIDEAEAFAGIRALKWTLFVIGILGALIISVFAYFVAKLIAKPILDLSRTIQQVESEGNFSLLLENESRDEVGETARAFNKLLANLSTAITGTNMVLEELGKGNTTENVSENYSGQLLVLTRGVNVAVEKIEEANTAQREQAEIAQASASKAQAMAEQAEEQARQALIIKQALDVSATAAMIANTNFETVYYNSSLDSMFHKVESQVKQDIPQFNADELMGCSADIFFGDTGNHRSDIQNLQSSEERDMHIGGLTFKLTITPIRDADGAFLGSVFEWDNLTDQLAKQAEERRVADENARIRQALDSSSTSTMIADEDFNIIYMNDSLNGMMSGAEADLQKYMGKSFDVKALTGKNMDVFHKDPSHQRKLLANLKTTYSNEVTAGTRTFSITANPIVDAEGNRLGTVVEWGDRTAEIAVEREIDQIIERAAKGDFSATIDLKNKDGFFHKVSEGINALLHTTNMALDDILRVFAALAEGDLTQKIEQDYEGDFAKLKSDANETVAKLNEIIGGIASASQNIARGASEISAGNADLSQRTEEQASSLEETASSMEQITTIVKQSEENAQQANNLANSSIDIARKGDESVKATATAMTEIADASRKISNIIGVIDEIAFQTNLLALNAAVEAARAGEQGRGFAVVAGEVRNLAQRSASAAKEIKDLIQDSVSKVEGGSVLVEESGKNLRAIVEEIEQVGAMMDGIVSSAKEQSTGIEQVNTAVNQMDQMTQQNAALVEEASAASESMAEQASQMDTMISFFKK